MLSELSTRELTFPSTCVYHLSVNLAIRWCRYVHMNDLKIECSRSGAGYILITQNVKSAFMVSQHIKLSISQPGHVSLSLHAVHPQLYRPFGDSVDEMKLAAPHCNRAGTVYPYAVQTDDWIHHSTCNSCKENHNPLNSSWSYFC